MKTYLILILYFWLSCLNGNAQAQEEQKDSLINETQNHALYFNTEKQHYYFVNANDFIVYDNLKYAREIMKKYQVIDQQNNMFYLDESLTKSDNIEAIYRICGNYNTYTLNIEEIENYFIAASTTINKEHEDSTIVTKTIFDSIPKILADSVFFLNGKIEYVYESIYYFGRHALTSDVNEKRIIIKKDGKYGFWDNKEITELFDKITISKYFKVKKNGLWGYETITDIKYTVLENFDYFLARFEYKDGRKGFLDEYGKEYFD